MGLWERFQNFRQGTRPGARQAETPEQTVDRAIAEMADALQKSHAHFAELTTFERQIRAERDKAVAESRRLENDARRHVLTGRDDLARQSLVEKAGHDRAAADFGAQWDAHNAVMVALERQIAELVKQHRDAIRNRDLFLARQRATDAQERVRRTLESAQAADPTQAMRDAEARAVAEAELAGHIPARTRRAEIPDPEAQFDALREEVAPQKNAAPAPNPPPLWFPDEPTRHNPAPTKPRDIWFDDAPKPASVTPVAPSKPRDIWFADEPASTPVPVTPAHNLPDAAALSPGANRVLPTTGDIRVSMGWQSVTVAPVAACAILIGIDGLARGIGDVVAVPQKQSPDGSLVQDGVPVPHPADATIFVVRLATVPNDVSKIVFAVFVDEETATRPLNRIVSAVYLRVLSGNANSALATVLLTPTEPNRALLLAEVYRHNGTWKVRALGQGFENGLEALLQTYGITNP